MSQDKLKKFVDVMAYVTLAKEQQSLFSADILTPAEKTKAIKIVISALGLISELVDDPEMLISEGPQDSAKQIYDVCMNELSKLLDLDV